MMLHALLQSDPVFRPLLFSRGFLLTNRELVDVDGFPLYGIWTQKRVGAYLLYLHSASAFHRVDSDDRVHILIGHAYDPFSSTHDESSLLETAAAALARSRNAYFEALNDWTGRFATGWVQGADFEILQDCAGMRSVFYGKVGDGVYVSSHAQLIGDVCGLVADSMIQRLISSPAYRIGVRFLPGSLSPFKELKRLGPNTSLRYDGAFRLQRFYPSAPIEMIESERRYHETVETIGDTLTRSMELTLKKWSRPAVSLTGGTDSRVTLAAVRGSYQRFRYFTFSSNREEANDARAAGEITGHLDIPHDLHPIPKTSSDIANYEAYSAIVLHNAGYVRANAPNDLRKMAYFAETAPYDVDVKSWVSEIGRSNFCKRLGVKRLPERLTPRHLSILYKRIFFDRHLLKWVDEAFTEYMEETGFGRAFFNIDDADMVYWEHRFPGWGALCLNEFDMCWETTMIFNNRRIVEKLLSFPREDRIQDNAHKAIVRYLNPKLAELDLHVVNFSKRRGRVALERMFFEVNSRLP